MVLKVVAIPTLVTSPVKLPDRLAALVAVEALPVKLPVTFPVTLPVTFPVRLPVTLPVTSPIKSALIVPASKFPDASLRTNVDDPFKLVPVVDAFEIGAHVRFPKASIALT